MGLLSRIPSGITNESAFKIAFADAYQKEFGKAYKGDSSDGASLAGTWKLYNEKLGTTNTPITDTKQNFGNKAVDFVRGTIDTQKTQSSQYAEGEMFRISNMLDIINKKGQVTGGLMGMASRLVEEVGGGIATQLKQEAQLRTDINEKVGMQGELSKGLREEIIDAYPSTLRLGYGMQQLTDMMTNMMSESGRFNLISKETIGQAAATARSFVGDLSEMGRVFGQFEKVGLGASDATKAIDTAGKSSLS
jgi:hypothetical protein